MAAPAGLYQPSGRTLVGMVLQGGLAVGLLDLRIARALADAQQLVVALVVHWASPAAAPHAAHIKGEAPRASPAEATTAEEHVAIAPSSCRRSLLQNKWESWLRQTSRLQSATTSAGTWSLHSFQNDSRWRRLMRLASCIGPLPS